MPVEFSASSRSRSCRLGLLVIVSKQADLRCFIYPINGTATQFVEADAKTFDPFAATVWRDTDAVLLSFP